MDDIKFSHKYFKLDRCFIQGNNKAKLLQAIKIHYNDLSKDMIQYDASYPYITGEHKDDYTVLEKWELYNLPKTDLILLILISDYFAKIFTTIRRFTDSKYKYYKSNEGKMFNVIIEG